jgi:hypothetical protein
MRVPTATLITAASGIVSRVTPVHTAVRNCMAGFLKLRQYPKSKQKAPPEGAHLRMKMKAGDAERSGPLGFVLDGDIRNDGCSRGHPGIIPGLAGGRTALLNSLPVTHSCMAANEA